MSYTENTTFLTVCLLYLCCWCACEEVSPNSTILISPVSEAGSDEKEMLHQEEKNCSNHFQEKEFSPLKNGSLLLSTSSDIYSNRSYFEENSTAFISIEINKSIAKSTPQYSDEFLRCGVIPVQAGGYKVLENGSVYIEKYFKTYGPRDHIIKGKAVYICIPKFNGKGSRGTDGLSLGGKTRRHRNIYAYITIVGLLLSIVSLLAHLTIFCIFSTVRNFPGFCLASLCASLLVSYLCFTCITFAEGTYYCASLGICIYYFFLKSFLWMNAISFDIWYSFRKILLGTEIPTHTFSRKKYFSYFLYCSLVPAALAIFAKVADSIDFVPEDYRPSFGHPSCWFGHRKALLVFFGVPLSAIMALNVFFFLYVIYVINHVSMRRNETQIAMMKRRFWIFTRLSLLMGLTWIIGLIAGNVENEFLWFLFVILNTFQGVFIFAIFSCSSKVRKLYVKRKRMYPNRKIVPVVKYIPTPAAATVV